MTTTQGTARRHDAALAYDRDDVLHRIEARVLWLSTAINYLLGELEESQLTPLREFGGLQAYPSRTKDPDPVDYSTGSVGLGATAPM